MKRKIIPILFSTCLLSGLLVGCGSKDPTAEELFTDPFKAETLDSMTCDIDVVLAGSIDLGAASEDSENVTISGDTTMSASLSADILTEIDTENQTTHSKGNMNVNIFGMDMTDELEDYTIQNTDMTCTTYTYNSDTNEWTYSEDETDDLLTLDTITDLTSMEFDNSIFTIKDTNPENFFEQLFGKTSEGQYIATCQTTMDELAKMSDEFQEQIDNSAFSNDTLDLSKFTVNYTYTFDKKTESLSNVKINVSGETDVLSISDFSIEIAFSDINKTTVIIPDDIVNNAVEEEDFFIDSNFTDDISDPEDENDFLEDDISNFTDDTRVDLMDTHNFYEEDGTHYVIDYIGIIQLTQKQYETYSNILNDDEANLWISFDSIDTGETREYEGITYSVFVPDEETVEIW